MTHERHFSNEDPAIGAGTPDEREFRRDVFVTPSWRYADPRRNLLMQAALDQHRADGYSVRQERRGVVVLDNLKEGVLTPAIYDPTLNPLYTRRARPLRRSSPCRDGQAYLDRWERRWADTRIHGTTKRQVAAMFEEERPALGPLPLEPFRYYQYGRRSVHLDGCVEVAAAYYSAPPGWIGRRVDVQWDDIHVRLLDPGTGQLLREHLRTQHGWHRIADDDRPARIPPKTLALLAAAKRAGPAISAVCDHIHRHGAPPASAPSSASSRSPESTVPPSSNTPPPPRSNLGVPTYSFLKRYLDRHPGAPPLSLRQVDPLIRELTVYGDLIDRRIGDPS